MCEMAFCSGKLQQKTKLMCLRPLIFIKKRRRIIAAKFATVIEELVAIRIVCLLSFLRKCCLPKEISCMYFHNHTI